MNWKERRHKRLRKRFLREPWFRELSPLQKGKWRKALYYLHFLGRVFNHERT